MLLSASVYSPPDDRDEVEIQGVARVASSKFRRLAFWGLPCPHAPLVAPVGSSHGPTGVSVTSTLHCRRLTAAVSLLMSCAPTAPTRPRPSCPRWRRLHPCRSLGLPPAVEIAAVEITLAVSPESCLRVRRTCGQRYNRSAPGTSRIRAKAFRWRRLSRSATVLTACS